jgi:hypothetical protein
MLHLLTPACWSPARKNYLPIRERDPCSTAVSLYRYCRIWVTPSQQRKWHHASAARFHLDELECEHVKSQEPLSIARAPRLIVLRGTIESRWSLFSGCSCSVLSHDYLPRDFGDFTRVESYWLALHDTLDSSADSCAMNMVDDIYH